MKRHTSRGLGLLLLMLALVTLACGLGSGGSDGPPRNAVVVPVVANTSLLPWLELAVSTFNATNNRTADDKPIFVTLEGVESGQAVATFADTTTAIWIPDNEVWVNTLADQGNPGFQGDCVSVAESPLVIGMWRPVAESLGWPGLPLGWLDVGSLAADPASWQYYSGGQYGESLRLGHTHPGLSGSGASTLLALVQAAQSQTTAVTTEQIQQPIVQASVGAFESAVSWFSSSTQALGEAMRDRGATFLGAAVMYESTVVQYGGGEIVPVYPFEGTFMATHPACVSQTADSATRDAALAFRAYLLGPEGQREALANGLRPVNSSIPPGAPLDESRGVDLAQPAIVFNPPTVETLYAVQALWQSARKDVNLVMLLDTSGSMRGAKIENMRQAAVQFVQQMGDDDYLTLVAFATEPVVLIQHEQVGPARDQIIATIQNLVASGDTTLFDAIGDGAALIAATTAPDTTNAMVVLSDGQDTRSYRYRFNDDLINTAVANDTTIFTIAYGSDADERTMDALAQRANGNFFRGDEASIAAIYEEMSAAFGGSVGVGR
jgi:Ca-activated chloride channel homolog